MNLRAMDGPFDCVILNGVVVSAADVGQYDIGIKDGKIALLAPAWSLKNTPATRVIDAEGAMVMVSSSHYRLEKFNVWRFY